MSIRATASVEEQERFGSCFACGMANDAGLKLDFEAVGDKSVTALYVPQEQHQGWPNVLHGGIVATIADGAEVQRLLDRVRAVADMAAPR